MNNDNLPIIEDGVSAKIDKPRDIGIVFLPNQECKEFAQKMTVAVEGALPSFAKAQNEEHITAIHIANVRNKDEQNFINDFHEFFANVAKNCIALPIIGINATGGNQTDGYKWLDLQFATLPALAELRANIVEKFCPYHNGILTRMNDDMASFNDAQKADIEKCGITYSKYLPHITAWYINLPLEAKQTMLQQIAESFAGQYDNLTCHIEKVAMVELGRNGNAMNVIDTISLCEKNHSEL